jgi:hypothetical protein
MALESDSARCGSCKSIEEKALNDVDPSFDVSTVDISWNGVGSS